MPSCAANPVDRVAGNQRRQYLLRLLIFSQRPSKIVLRQQAVADALVADGQVTWPYRIAGVGCDQALGGREIVAEGGERISSVTLPEQGEADPIAEQRRVTSLGYVGRIGGSEAVRNRQPSAEMLHCVIEFVAADKQITDPECKSCNATCGAIELDSSGGDHFADFEDGLEILQGFVEIALQHPYRGQSVDDLDHRRLQARKLINKFGHIDRTRGRQILDTFEATAIALGCLCSRTLQCQNVAHSDVDAQEAACRSTFFASSVTRRSPMASAAL